MLRAETRTDQTLLRAFASAFGFFVWFPALGLPAGPLSLQLMDLLAFASWPIVIAYLPKIRPRSAVVIAMSCLSALLAYRGAGSLPILIYYLAFVTPFLMTISHIIQRDFARIAFLKSLVFGGAMSCALFLAQVAIGADSLDFRTNTSFSLPPQHERGFGLFPEVSTFATHTIYLLAVLTVFWCSSRESKTDRLSGVIPMLFIAVTCLFLSKSSSVLIVLPAILIMAYLKGRPLTYRGLLGVVLGTAVLTVALQLYYTEFYLQRAEGSALRSMGLRLITIKTGLSVLENGEAFGVGLGNNEAVTLRAFAVAQEMGFPLLLLPKGVNSFVVARVFEEGWPALFCFGLATFYLLIAILSRFEDAALRCIVVLSLASFLVSLLVTGYRGIYMNWFWISAAPALIDWSKDRVSSVGKDAKCKH